ncbi:hypothetical protein [Bacillus sp. FJAT-26390]|uniref:hypothetical protein n=1 Tax=Bacillus sp. FJAT-26390 TaxID=1743142 RepID=UPI001146D18E|nr:hypothetical protein [Bacillus sp. FJAT-26390]
MSNEILTYKKKYKRDLEEYSATLSNLDRIRNQSKKVSPQIGMSSDEVRSSSWGAPEDTKKTTTKYGVSEQWVYANGRYVYFDDGEVTAIQE